MWVVTPKLAHHNLSIFHKLYFETNSISVENEHLFSRTDTSVTRELESQPRFENSVTKSDFRTHTNVQNGQREAEYPTFIPQL